VVQGHTDHGYNTEASLCAENGLHLKNGKIGKIGQMADIDPARRST
jgi:hypothetical protein